MLRLKPENLKFEQNNHIYHKKKVNSVLSPVI